MTDDVFNESDTADQTVQDVTPEDVNTQETSEPVDVFADKLASITNEDGTPKYSDVASALESIPHAQQHISTLEKEAKELREKLAREQAAKDLLAKQLGAKPTQQPQSLTEDDIARIALEAQTKAEQQRTAESNVAAVNSTFSELYGSKAKEQMQTLAKESGMSVSQIRELAKSSPTAVYRLAGIEAPKKGGTPPPAPGQGTGDIINPPPTPPQPKSVMGGSNSKDLVDAWKTAGEIARSNQ